jgi:hypothetical protein
MDRLYLRQLCSTDNTVSLIASRKGCAELNPKPDYKGKDALITFVNEDTVPEDSWFIPRVDKKFAYLAGPQISNFLTHLSLDVNLTSSEVFYTRDVLFLTSTGGLTSCMFDYGKISISKLVSLKQSNCLLIHEQIGTAFSKDLSVVIQEYPLRFNLTAVSTYAFFRRFTLLLRIIAASVNFNISDSIEPPLVCHVQPGGFTKPDLLLEFKSQVNVPEFKIFMLKFQEVFDWGVAIKYVADKKCAIDFRTSKLIPNFTPINVKSIVFSAKSDMDPVVSVHNLMRHTFENKVFNSLEDFKYPLTDFKTMSVRSRSTYLRNRFRKYSSDETNCLVFIPGTGVYGEGSGKDKGESLLAACVDFLKFYESCSLDDLNEIPADCPRCGDKHQIELCRY